MSEVDPTSLKLIPAPVGGLNSRDPLHAMPENQAIEMTNFWPENAYVINRGGTTLLWQCPDAGFTECYGLWAYPSESQTDLADSLVAALNNPGTGAQKLYKIPLSTLVGADISGGAGCAYAWGFPFMMRRDFYLANVVGGDTVTYGPVLGATALTGWTGIGAGQFIRQGCVYKGRVYLCVRGIAAATTQPSVYYGGLLAGNGALAEFSVRDALTKGGNVSAVGTLTQEGDASQNLFIIVSTMGEVLLYQGDYPGSATWSIRGRYFIGEPLGPGCIIYIGGDAHIMCADGIIPVSNLIGNVRVGSKYATITDPIGPTWRASVEAWRASAILHSLYWYAAVSSTRNMLVIIAADVVGGNGTCFMQNIETQAWMISSGLGDFVTEVKGRVFFASTTAQVGGGAVICELGKPGVGNTDYRHGDGVAVPVECSFRQAFNYLDDPSHEKHITSIKAFFDLTAAAGHSVVTREVKIGADSDFADADQTNQVLLQGIVPDGTVNYVLPCDVRAEGTAFSMLFKARFGGGYTLKLNMFIANYEPGGFLT